MKRVDELRKVDVDCELQAIKTCRCLALGGSEAEEWHENQHLAIERTVMLWSCRASGQEKRIYVAPGRNPLNWCEPKKCWSKWQLQPDIINLSCKTPARVARAPTSRCVLLQKTKTFLGESQSRLKNLKISAQNVFGFKGKESWEPEKTKIENLRKQIYQFMGSATINNY